MSLYVALKQKNTEQRLTVRK